MSKEVERNEEYGRKEDRERDNKFKTMYMYKPVAKVLHVQVSLSSSPD